MLWKIYFCFILFAVINQSLGIIYHLNDTEYEQLPALFELENYESCMDRPEGVYCLAHLELYAEPHNSIYRLVQEYSMHSTKHYNYSKVDRGICVSRSCRDFSINTKLDVNKELSEVVERCLNKTMRNKYGLNARVSYMNCDKQTESTQIDLLDCTVASIFILLITVTFIASYSKVGNENGSMTRAKQILRCFSVPRNITKLTAVEHPDSRFEDLKGLHGVRTVFEAMVVYAHVTLIMTTFTSDPHTLEKIFESIFHRVSLSGMSIVQVFFLISGFLLTFFLQMYSEGHKLTLIIVLKGILYRWIKLTAPAALVIAFVATWLRHLGAGPLWKRYISYGTSAQCRQYFWTHILYYNNYVPENSLCAFQTWHTAVDMQLFILGLIVHYLIRNKSLQYKLGAIAAFSLIGFIGPALHVWLQDLNAFVMQTPEVLRMLGDETFWKYHVYTHNNIMCYAMGMANGYLAHYFQREKIVLPHFKIGNFLCWSVVPALVGILYVSSLFYVDGDRPPIFLRALFAATHRIAIGLSITVWLLGAVLKFNGCFRDILEWQMWVVAGRLSYGVFMIHNVIIFYLIGSRTQLYPISFINLFLMTIGVLVISNILALTLYLLVEAPVNQLLKITMTDEVKEKKRD